VFAETTRQLNHLDERQAAVAGLRGAVRLFGVTGADIVIDGPLGPPRAYTLVSSGAVTRTEPPGPTPRRPAAVRHLLVGGIHIGELRLHRDTPLGRRDGLVLAAYGDALAAALHDAGTNTELRTLAERSTFDAVHDPLTGLPNRTSLLNRGTALLRSLDPAAPVALLLLDINDFKNVNTTLGIAAGDELLRRAAGRLGRSGEPGDLLARLGGDEFALLITGTGAGLDDALDRARHLAEELAAPIEVSGVQLSVESSTGVVVAAAGSIGMTELLRRADIAMYQAKRAGSSVVCYEQARDDASTDRLALLAELREALAGRDQIDVVLQPSVALETGRPVGVEAFVRWRHPRRGTLIPRDFVRAVEQSELLGAFTRCVLDRALAVAGALSAQGTPLPVSVNLSPRSLHDRHLPRDVAALLERHHVPADRLVLEITETVVLSSDRVVDEVLGELRQLGAQLAVDDFGTGCSALTFLTRVPVDEVKIDRTFVTRMVDSPEAAAIVRTTVELARELGLRVVAEGVESAEQRAALMALSCPSAQGFHFYATMNADRMLDVAREAAALAAAEAAAAAAAMAAAAEAPALLAAEAAAVEADGRRVRRLRAAE
jgi:diguanylate cyclase (GGDEF)-like protein